MSGPIDIWRPVADKWTELYARVDDGDWNAPTPCSDWTVRDLIEHNLHWQATGGAMLGAATGVDDDWQAIREAYESHLSDPSNLDGTVEEFAGIPRQELAAFLIGDLLIHSWDLARSIGADEVLPAAAVEATMAGLHHVPEGLLRGRNPLGQPMMGPAIDISDDASTQDRMLAFSGRRA
ncbi:MAG: hypothetical protein JWO22_3329 [Frankiales bacterium]|nr:hypothetical protein [Frankiales bacterium]